MEIAVEKSYIEKRKTEKNKNRKSKKGNKMVKKG